MKLKTILVPVDFGKASKAALDHAVMLARAFDGNVVLLHAFEIPAIGFPDAGLTIAAEMLEHILDGAEKGLEDLRTASEYKGVPITSRVVQAEPWRAVLEAIARDHADLVVMGTHGRRGLPRALIGSVTEKVVRTSPVPVLTVHAEPERVSQ